MTAGRYSSDVKEWAANYPPIEQPPKINPNDPDQILTELDLGNTHPVIVNFVCKWVICNEPLKDSFQPKTQPTYSEKLVLQMQSELQEFKDFLLKQSPDEVLNHAYEYSVKVDIVAYAESNDIPDDISEKLLLSKIPLEDVYLDIRKKDSDLDNSIKDTIEYIAEQRAHKEAEKTAEFSPISM